MKRTFLLATLWMMAHSAASFGAEEAADCGARYPAEFPCLPGGLVAQAPSIPFPHLKSMGVLIYGGTPAELSTRFAEMLKAAGWQVHMHTGEEPDGTRYRMQVSRDGRKVSASIFADGGRAVLQVMEFEPH